MTFPDNEVRVIESAPPPARYARGWHCLGLLDEFRDGKPHAVEAFGSKLVVFADSAGSLNVLNGYCPHMGGDLTQGTIKGDSVACPFHDWRWAGNGRCSNIPYARRVPPLARTKAWTTLERNGQLYVWHDPQGNPPPPEVTIPQIPGYDTGEWTEFTWNRLTIEGSHCREIVDNVVDMAHFFYIHYSFPVYFKNVFEGHVASQNMNTKPRPDVDLGTSYSRDDDAIGRSEAAYYGPSYMIDYLWSPSPVGELETVLINCHYPVSPTSFVLQWGAAVKKPESLTDEEATGIAQAFTKGVELGFVQDVEIWRNKAKIDNPLLCEEDGPVYQLRRWYEQFYVDVEDVTPEMTRRFEFEIDTERAISFWHREVEENIAAGRFVTSDPRIEAFQASENQPAGTGA
ncbi:Rieske 2Fe-2S domain-containing protein [Rhodococcus coprophilus]|uniref:Rieske-type oxygenase n=1 Tax=Rhodococcus coprophilus TaxID=38310 RepID=A0A2X4U8W5_9NOCA|nr:Rieske 2Fe-2S domain-containing protein [Rhodococcus coprophilus]MBM7459492.1 3-ketosteroid 9alpha-monooxygenase subunit A [Rhodococcus coprophilus]SQI36246.1 dioxygenase Rieske iron-sulfur component [Rhodococcus coprophilus]